MLEPPSHCVLCHAESPEPWRMPDGVCYSACAECGLVAMDNSFHLEHREERERYLLHQTEVEDSGYRTFVQPLMDAIRARVPKNARGLDFGAGHQPVLAEHFRSAGYSVELYDPFFWPEREVLRRRYNFVVACEVVEHFYNPREGFGRLFSLLEKGGTLAVQTEPMVEQAKFAAWYYRRDPSHVAFYSARTASWIAKHFGIADFTHHRRVTTFTTPV